MEEPGLMYGCQSTYIDFFTGLVYSGDRELDMYRDLHSIPVLAKAGAIVPMTEEIFGQEAARNPETMTIRVYGGADGSFQLYEDDNESNAYLKDECVLTDMDLKWSIGRFVIHKAAGRLELIPQKRTWTVEFWGVKDTEVTVEVEGTGAEASKEYDEALGCLVVSVPEISATSEIIITLGTPELRENDGKTQVFNLLNQAEIPYMEKVASWKFWTRRFPMPPNSPSLPQCIRKKELWEQWRDFDCDRVRYKQNIEDSKKPGSICSRVF